MSEVVNKLSFLNPHIFHIFTKTKSPKPYTNKSLRLSNRAADRNRTGTGITTHGILSPGRLPVPPLRQEMLIRFLRKAYALCTVFSTSHQWAEVDSNHRSKLQQIYSLSPLATRESIHMELYSIKPMIGLEPITC